MKRPFITLLAATLILSVTARAQDAPAPAKLEATPKPAAAVPTPPKPSAPAAKPTAAVAKAPAPTPAPPKPAPVAKLSLNTTAGAPYAFIGPDDRHQVIVTATTTTANGVASPVDVTHQASYKVHPPQIAEITSDGFLRPLADGSATLTATFKNATPVSSKIQVQQSGTPQAINFANQIVPLFTRHGCNGGGCHGKSGGQNDFRLSLLGYEPWNDYEYLTRETRGRRISPAAPEHSLLLTKATGETPHGGGARIDLGSYDYRMLVRWIEQGMPEGQVDDPTVDHIEVFPRERVIAANGRQQLAVTAHYSDGSTHDVSRAVQFEANQPEMAEVDELGMVSILNRTGSTSVMIRFQEHVDVFQATVPLGIKMPPLPKPDNLIDEHIFTKLELLGLPPSTACDDSTFLRRVTLDIAGRLPTVTETETFLADRAADKRTKKVDSLLETPEYADVFAGKWSAVLRNKRDKAEHARQTYAFHGWIRESMAANVPYDQFVTELLTASGDVGTTPAVAWYRAVKDRKEQMQDIAQVFLGIRMQCAQCHHHPYEKWSQDDYYGFTAFFSTIGRKTGDQPGEEIIFAKRATAGETNPNTKVTLKPTPLGEAALELSSADDPRDSLADWMTDSSNPYFARMLVNRYWKHFFSRGLVEPEDDMRVTNPATHPRLLQALADQFVADGYDLKQLIRNLCNSQTYQLAALPNAHNIADGQNYSRYYPKRLPAEVLLDAINDVTATRNTFTGQPAGVRAIALPDDKANSQSYFLTVFGRPEMASACECERTTDANLAQSLHLINSDTIHKKLSDIAGRASLLAQDMAAGDGKRITELYLQALSRRPDSSEIALATAHLEKKRRQLNAAPTPAPVEEGETPPPPPTAESLEREAFEDLVWALLNTKEFLFNH